MTDSPARPVTADAPDHIARTRECLRCSRRFASTWAGERICPKCKNSNAWRSGQPVSSHPVNRRR